MPRVVIGEPQEGIRFIDEADKYALRLNGYDYYSSGMKLSRTGTHGYTGTVQFEKIKTDADGNVVDTKSGDQVMQLYSNGTNSAGEFVSGPSIIGKLDADIGTGTTSSGRFEFRPDGGSGAAIKCIMDTDGLKFNGDLAAANALDDYEEGTWTLGTRSGVTLSGGSAGSGYYTKIGRMVYASCVVTPSAVTSSSTYFDVTGLPYVAKGDSYAFGGGSAMHQHSTSYLSQLMPFVGNGNDYIRFYQCDAGAWDRLMHSDISTATDMYVTVNYYV